jgi:hypothetical protein
MGIKIILIASYLFVTTAFSNFGCNSSENKKEVKNSSLVDEYNSYFPVQAGNKWEYINEAPGEDTELVKVKVDDVKLADNIITAELSSFPFFSMSRELTTLKVQHDGEIFVLNNKSNKEELFMPSPSDFKKGYTWQFGEWKGIIGSTHETIKTESGTFDNCIFLNFSIYYTFSAEIWIAKDKGIVKWGYNRTNPPTLKPKYYVLNKLSLAK